MKKLVLLSALSLFGFAASSQTQTWTSLSGIPGGVHHPVTFAIGDYGYSVTGVSSFGADTDDMLRYNPVTDSWSTMSDFPGGVRGFSIGLEYQGSGYIGFGYGAGQFKDDLWRFDTANNQWTQLADCPCKARRHPAMMAANGKIYVGLGNDNVSDLRDFWVYDISADSWSQLPNIPASSRHHPFMFALNGDVFAGMGHGGNFIYKDWFKLDTVNNSWTTMNSFPGEARVAGTQFDHNGFGYVLSGDGDNHNFMATGEMWRYDSNNDSWSQQTAHPGVSRWAPGSFVIGDTLYFFGGVNRATSSFPTDMFKYAFNSAGIGLDENNNSSFSLYPNPTNGILNFEGENEIREVQLSNINGQFIESYRAPTNSIELPNLPNGIYLIRIEDDNGRQSYHKIWLK
jgi:N-acetylneuraminic acid mutarotase